MYLADLNNEDGSHNETYAENMRKLKFMLLVKSTNDEVIEPQESSWMGQWLQLLGSLSNNLSQGYYAPGTSTVVPMNVLL